MARTIISGSKNSVSGEARKAFQIKGIQELTANVSKVLNAANARAVKTQVYMPEANRIRDLARQLAPYDPGRKKGTHLRDNIFAAEGDPYKANVMVGVVYGPRRAPHAHLIEFGHATRNGGFVAPQPYMRPAVVTLGPSIATNIKDGLRKIIAGAL